jgi:hypothetical protein
VCGMKFRVVLHMLEVFCKGSSALLKVKSSWSWGLFKHFLGFV